HEVAGAGDRLAPFSCVLLAPVAGGDQEHHVLGRLRAVAREHLGALLAGPAAGQPQFQQPPGAEQAWGAEALFQRTPGEIPPVGVTQIDVRGRTSVCDYMVIASGTST